jgi:hypothetical protein
MKIDTISTNTTATSTENITNNRTSILPINIVASNSISDTIYNANIIPLSNDVFQYVLLPLLQDTDAIHTLLTTQHYYTHFYTKYDFKKKIVWTKIQKYLQLMHDHKHELPRLRTLICDSSDSLRHPLFPTATIDHIAIMHDADSLLNGTVQLPASLKEFEIHRLYAFSNPPRSFTYKNAKYFMIPSLKRLVLPINFHLKLNPGMLPNTLEYG